jgi:hypothetical protein
MGQPTRASKVRPGGVITSVLGTISRPITRPRAKLATGSLGARRAPLSYPGEPCWSAGSRCGHEGFGRAGPGSPHSAPGARTGSRFRPGRKIRLRVPPGEVVPIGTPLAAELGGVGSMAAPAPAVVPRAEGGRVSWWSRPQPVPGPFQAGTGAFSLPSWSRRLPLAPGPSRASEVAQRD